MPHMANLSWIFLFCLFNVSLLMTFCVMNLSNIIMVQNKKSHMTLYKKWQW